MYTYETQVGFSHVDTNKNMKMEALAALFQDVTCFQGEELGVGFGYVEPMKVAWVLNSWQIDVKRFPRFNEKITVGTFPTGFKSFIGTRNFLVKDEAGRDIVMANSLWTFMDMEKMRPAKIDGKFLEVYDLEEPLPMEYLERKIELPKDEDADWIVVHRAPVTVREYHLDSNMHVNNGQYVQIASGFFPRDKQYDRLRVEYRRQAVLGDEMIPVVYEKEGVCIVSLEDKERKPHAIAEASVIA